MTMQRNTRCPDQHLLDKKFKHFREARMTADRIEIGVVFHPPLSFLSGAWEKVHQ